MSSPFEYIPIKITKIVKISHDKLLQDAQNAAAAKAAKLEAHAAAHAAHAAEQMAEEQNNMQNMAKSPSDISCLSYELFVGQEKGNDDNNKEKMSIRSEGLESVSEMQRPAPYAIASGTNAAKVRKVSAVSMLNAFARTTFIMRYEVRDVN